MKIIKKPSSSTTAKTNSVTRKVFFLLLLVAEIGSAVCIRAQGQLPGGNISGSGAGPYNFSLTFANAPGATAPIGSVWYAWIPGFFYLPGVPTSPSAPAGWTATVSGDSIQFVANSSASDILAGHSLSGFGYHASFPPAQLAAASNSGVSVAYSGGLFSDAGTTFTVQAIAVPEPATLALLISGATILFITRRNPTNW